MLKYAVVEITGRQYLVEPGKELLVNNLGEVKNLECERVLLLSDGEKLQFGDPYLKEKLSFDVLEQVKSKKIRVFKYHAKANTRKITGSRAVMSKIRISEKKAEKPAKEAVKKA
jgi:large subunit ribosomal protein L21